MKTAIVVLLIIMLLALSFGLIFIVRNNDKNSVPDNVGDNIIPDDDSPFFSIPENALSLTEPQLYFNVVEGEVRDYNIIRTWKNLDMDIQCADVSFDVIPGKYEFYLDKDYVFSEIEFTSAQHSFGQSGKSIKIAWLNPDGDIQVTKGDLIVGWFDYTAVFMNSFRNFSYFGNKISIEFLKSIYGPGVFLSSETYFDMIFYPNSCTSDMSYGVESGEDDYYLLKITVKNKKSGKSYKKDIPIYCVDRQYGRESCPDFTLLKNRVK